MKNIIANIGKLPFKTNYFLKKYFFLRKISLKGESYIRGME